MMPHNVVFSVVVVVHDAADFPPCSVCRLLISFASRYLPEILTTVQRRRLSKSTRNMHVICLPCSGRGRGGGHVYASKHVQRELLQPAANITANSLPGSERECVAETEIDTISWRLIAASDATSWPR